MIGGFGAGGYRALLNSAATHIIQNSKRETLQLYYPQLAGPLKRVDFFPSFSGSFFNCNKSGGNKCPSLLHYSHPRLEKKYEKGNFMIRQCHDWLSLACLSYRVELKQVRSLIFAQHCTSAHGKVRTTSSNHTGTYTHTHTLLTCHHNYLTSYTLISRHLISHPHLRIARLLSLGSHLCRIYQSRVCYQMNLVDKRKRSAVAVI